MKNNFVLPLALVLALAGCSKPTAEKAADTADKAEAKSGVTMDAEMQARIGLKIEAPVEAQWQPETKGFGRVIETATLVAAETELDAARTAAEVSIQEFTRQKNLAAQENASARALETAKAAFTQANSAYAAAEAKFKLEWGSAIADPGNLIDNNTMLLVRIDLPSGENLPTPPASARIVALTDETKVVPGKFVSVTDGVNPQTQSRGFFFSITNGALPLGAAVTGYLKTSGAAAHGVVVPPEAVLRHEGKGWIYVQAETNRFVRMEIPLDSLTENGWFVPEGLSATNRVVTIGAQTVLSAELGGGFGTGARD